MLLGTVRLTLADGDRFRHQQRLATQAFAGHGDLQTLVGDALVGRVHVHQHQPVGVLGEDVDTLELRQGVAQRRDILRAFRQRLRRRRVGQRREEGLVSALGLGQRRNVLTRRLIAVPAAGRRRTGRTRLPGARRSRSLQHALRQAHLALRTELTRRLPAGPRHGQGGRTWRRQLVIRAHLGQCPVQGAIEEVVHHATVAETHLVLGRVHVDIDHRRIDLEEQHEGRVTAVVQHVAIGLAHRVGDQLVAHHAAVHVEILQVRLAAREGRQADPAPQMQAVALDLDGQRLFEEA
ncbi:hypothetical protein D3C78_1148560 [compost metagenome]